ncbi:hypothetical protein VMA_002451 [Vibrio mimicus VM223]|nr:hypothetical protein VMA_002451 [Vibrio mimicus VM223]
MQITFLITLYPHHTAGVTIDLSGCDILNEQTFTQSAIIK